MRGGKTDLSCVCCEGRIEITEFMIILNSSAAVKSFMAKGSLTL